MDAETYAARDELLRTLGFGSYAEYLRSVTWKRIRMAVLRRGRFKCQLCGRKTWTVHHVRYTRAALLGETYDDMTPLCGKCHTGVEFDRDGEKRTLVDSQKSFRRIKGGRCLVCGRKTGRPAWRYCSLHYRKG